MTASAFESLSASMARFIGSHGLETVTAWPTAGLHRPSGDAIAAVSLRACQGGPGGFCDYLGETCDAQSGAWREIYGMKLNVVFALDLYAAPCGGEERCQRAFDRLAQALSAESPQGLKVLSFSRGEIAYDQSLDLVRCPAEATCQAWLYAVTDESGAFLDFEVKGVRL